MPSFIAILAAALPLLDLAMGAPALAERQAATYCVHDQCSKAISQTPHRPVCPAYLAAGPGVAPAPPTYTKLYGCNQDQIYSVCSCFFQPTATATSSTVPATSVPATTTDAPATTAAPATTTAAAVATTTSLNPQSPSPCPYPNGANYTTPSGNVYEVFCGYDVEYNDDPATYANSMGECINACAAFQPNDQYNRPCIAITYTGLYPFPQPSQVNCWLHYSAEYGQNSTSPYYDSAILIDSIYT